MEDKNESVIEVINPSYHEVLSFCSELLEELPEECSKVVSSIVRAEESLSNTISSNTENIDSSIKDLTENLNGHLSVFSSQFSEIISSTNDEISWTSIFFAVFVAFIGAFSAFLFNHFHWKSTWATNKSFAAGNELVELISKLEKEVLEYWVSGYDKLKDEEISISEIVIKSLIIQIDAQTKILISLVNKGIEKDISGFAAEIFDLATGDEFESKSRKPSKGKAMKIVKKCTSVRSDVSSIIMKI